MLQKSARFALALVLSLTLCPMVAFAEGEDGYWSDGGYAATQASELPVISDLDVDSDSITVEGSYFGATQGTSTVEVTTGGISGGDIISSDVSSWSDTQIILDIDDDLEGIVDVTITTDSGSDSMSKFVSVGPDVFEETLETLPDQFASDYAGPVSSSSILKGWGKYLYYLREEPVSDGGADFAFHEFDCYSIEAGGWDAKEVDDLPEWLAYASGCIWEGNFLVAGVVYDTDENTVTAEERVFMYNFELGEWGELDAEGVPLGAGIVNLDGFLKVVGGADSDWNLVDDVYDFDTDTGLGDRYATLETPAFCPQLAVNQGQIFVYSYGDSYEQYNGDDASRHLQVVTEGEAVELDGVFPEFASVSVPDGMPLRSEEFGSIAAAIEGLMLVGPPAADGGTDVYILDWDWEGSSFLPYYKRASDAAVYGAAACIHDNLLYVAAASELEPEHAVFRATEMIAPSVKSGNYQVWRQGSGDMLTITYTPDFSRFSLNTPVLVDGVELYRNDEYFVSSGSTVIDLTPEFLSTLALGEHEVIADFDGYDSEGAGAEVPAYFTIEGKATPVDPANPGNNGNGNGNGNGGGGGLAPGYTRPASLAMTGDLMLIVPFVILGAGAVGLGIYLVRRKIRNNN